MDHLMNCHGEWAILFTILGQIPLIGLWLKSPLRVKDPHNHNHGTP